MKATAKKPAQALMERRTDAPPPAEMKKVEAARKPRQNGSLGASGSNRPDETRKSTGGTFTGDNAVDTNF